MHCSAEFFYLLTAASRIGAILVGMGIRHSQPEILYTITNSKAEYIYCRAYFKPEIDYQERFEEVLLSAPWVKRIIVIGGMPTLKQSDSYDEIMTGDYSEAASILREREAALNTQDNLLMVYTSGTTANPKGALLTHQNIIHAALVTADEVNGGIGSVWLNHMPVHHISGATEIGASAVIAGATQVLLDAFHPSITLRCIEQYKISILGQVPFMYFMELFLPDFDDYNLSSLKCCVVSGAPLTEKLAIKIHQKMCQHLSNDLGMTETAGLCTFTRQGASPEEIASTVGRVPPEFEYKIVDEKKKKVHSGLIGELALRGTNVIKEYFVLPEATAQAVDSEGWFYSGDLAVLGEDGQLHMMGRLDEIYVTDGRNVYPSEIEALIGNFENVVLCACLGVPDRLLGQIGRAYIVVRPGTKADENKLREYLLHQLPEYKVPQQLIFRPILPLTAIGKVEKLLLKLEIAQEIKISEH